MFAVVECQFWLDKRVRKEMSEDARFLLLYLITCPHRNIIGLFYLPENYALNDLGWKATRYQAALHELLDLYRVSYDFEVDLILVHNHLKHNSLDNPNKVKGAITVLDSLPDTELLTTLVTFVDKYRKSNPDALLEYIGKRIKTFPEPFRKPYDTLSKPEAEPETEPEPEAVPKIDTYSSMSAEPTIASPTKKDIEFLVEEYRLILGGILPDIKKLTEERTRKAKGILKEFAVDEVVQAFKETAASDFLTGNTPKGWKANWDWIFNKANLAKILEGNYRNNRTGGPGPRTPKGIQGLADLMNGGSNLEN